MTETIKFACKKYVNIDSISVALPLAARDGNSQIKCLTKREIFVLDSKMSENRRLQV